MALVLYVIPKFVFKKNLDSHHLQTSKESNIINLSLFTFKTYCKPVGSKLKYLNNML